ncbi:MAG: glycosyltransferase family 1 protein [Patescibacteria group bacterium]
MHIAIDARMMGAGQTRGIGRYIEQMVEALKAERPDWHITLLQPDVPWYGLREQLEMPDLIKSVHADHVWFPHWNVPLLYRGDFSVTIHDLLLIHQPQSAKASTRHPVIAWLKHCGFKIVLNHALKKSRHIFVPTSAVKKDIVTFYPSVEKKIIVNGEGLSELPAPSDVRVSESPFLFYVGSAYPHKRLDLLLEAWKTLSENHPQLTLVIGGEQDVFMKRVQAQSEAMGLPRVRFSGHLSDQELADHYAQAAAFVFPSSFEGFGLPPCEALSLCTPVICADIEVLREVLPEQGVFFFKNGSADGMIEGIESVLVQGQSARTQALLGGEEIRRRHDWMKAAEMLASAVQKS